MNENDDKWGETVNGIMKILKNVNKEQEEFNYFDPFLNESIESIEKFVSEYIPKENIEIENIELHKNIKEIKIKYLKIGIFISKIFLENLFVEKEMKDFKRFIKKLCRVRDEIYEAISFCDEQNPNSESMNLFKSCKDEKKLKMVEKIKRKYLLLGFLLINPIGVSMKKWTELS